MNPSERHDVALAALDRQIRIAEAADRSRWMADVAHTASVRMRSEDDARYLVMVTPGSVLPWLAGRRSILVRHAPSDGRCTACLEWCDCIDGTRVEDCSHGNTPWPCPDWRDAAGLPEESTDG